MKIGELALSTGTQVETIRYYEREGLLPEPGRTESNYRIYSDVHVQRLSFVRHCRSLDMTLAEIRVLLRFKDAPTETCGEVNALLDAHIGHVATRISELRHLENQLKGLRALCLETQEAAHCGILTELTQAARQHPDGGASAAGHIHGAHKGGNPSRTKHAMAQDKK